MSIEDERVCVLCCIITGIMWKDNSGSEREGM